MSSESLRRDSEELIRLCQLTESVNVKRFLTSEAEKLKVLAEREQFSSCGSASKVKPDAVYTTKIVNYAWDQSDKFLKIYVTINGVHTFPTENISVEYGTKSFEMQALSSDKRNNVLAIKNLLHAIVPSESYHKVKTDMVALYLKKASSEHWSYVTEAEKKAKEPKTPKVDNKEEDPGSSLMTLMKQMYEDGDDEMKRTIAKAWTEARDKKNDEVMM